MAWLDATLAVLIVWVAIDVAAVAALMSVRSQRETRANERAPRPAQYGGLRLVSSRSGSARTP